MIYYDIIEYNITQVAERHDELEPHAPADDLAAWCILKAVEVLYCFYASV